MFNQLLKHVKDFLNLYWKEGQPVVVACSGGSDSKALLYLFLECQKFFRLDLQVAHIDHGWRAESAFQAQQLKEEVEQLKLPFHLYTLKDLPPKEDAAREARYTFFKQLMDKIGAQAIALGHQREDQAETVLKRVLEGASLPTCRGMRATSSFKDMMLWRPLLNIPKNDLSSWLDEQGISYTEDETNLSPVYLRGRFRSSILPSLEKSFGKSIIKNLCRLGERAQKIEQHLIKQVEHLWEKIEEESKIGLSLLEELDDVVLEYFLKEWAQREGIYLSIDQLSILMRMIRIKNTKLYLQTPTHRFEARQGKLAIKRV